MRIPNTGYVIRNTLRLPRKALIRLITLYQSTLSPDHGPLRHLFPHGYCPHHPTCSEFGKQVIERHGVILGTPRLIRRLLSCHPWTKPDDDAIRNAIEKTP
ncbi:MAG: membrane protein insertion efficiency factor YidD [Patescibacteria group bacterium]